MSVSRPTIIAPEWQRRLRVEEYHRMIDAAVFDEDERLELLEGVIVEMSPHGREHALAIQRVTRIFNRGLGDEYAVRPQLPLTLAPDSEPEPDLAIVSAEDVRRAERHPSTALLVVEVAADSLERDRGVKAALYARAGVPEYWIVNLVDRQVEIHLDPDRAAGRYRSSAIAKREDTLRPQRLPGLSVPTADVLG